MKLRNKKTGEIFDKGIPPKPVSIVIGNGVKCYDTIDAFSEEWEDYKEPEEQYYIKENGVIGTCGAIEDEIPDERLSEMKEIGNYFETKDDAEQAVERLKAWKRLKDKGFTFYDWVWDYKPIQTLKITAGIAFHDGIEADLDLLFGGEE